MRWLCRLRITGAHYPLKNLINFTHTLYIPYMLFYVQNNTALLKAAETAVSMQISVLTSLLSDIVSITALVVIGLYHILSFAMHNGKKTDRSDLSFAAFILSFAGCIFFSDTISAMFFSEKVSASINTVAVSFFIFVMITGYYSFLYQFLNVDSNYYFLKRASVMISFNLFLLSLLVWQTGYKWYFNHIGIWIQFAYGIIVIANSALCIFGAIKNDYMRSYSKVLFIFASHILILYLIIQKIMRHLSPMDLHEQHSLISLFAILFFPAMLVSKSNRERLELNSLREQLEKNKVTDEVQADKIKDFGLSNNLNETERLVLMHLLKGLEYKEIAHYLDLSLSGIKKRAHSLYKKSNVKNRTELINSVFDISV